ncbi:MAG: hypothetical protein PF542_02280 [Nanoarchaeota archaeon]|nr:hypothetical protein [Nanoarchaeota archaeon]
MKKRNNNLVRTLVLMVILIHTFSFVSAVNIGVSPAVLNFEDVMRSGYAEDYIAISADSEQPVDVRLEARGNIAEWLTYPEETFAVSKNELKYLKISIIPPSDTPNGNYTGFMKVFTESIAESVEDHAVGKIKSTLDLAITISVTDVESKACFAKNFEVSSAEVGDDVVLRMNVLNKGNVRLSPEVLFDIWDSEQIDLVSKENFIGESILPTIDRDIEFRIDSTDFELGQYWGDLSLPDCLQSSLLTFDILAEGALKSQGILQSILSKRDVKTKETVPFEASFKNTGEKDVKARFKGKATYNGQIVQVFESEELIVDQGSVEKFLMYFTPQKEGRYVISGRVYYDGKRTFEASSAIDVTGRSFSFLPLLYFVLIVFVAMMFFKVRREKRVYREKLRRLK